MFPTPRTPPVQDPRRAAPIVWGALLFGLLAFLVVASFVRPRMGPGDPALTRALLLVLAPLAVVNVALSRLLAPRVQGAPGASPDERALARNIVACALCEGAGLFAIVVFMLSGSPVALAILLLALAGLLACWPGDARWEALGGSPRDGQRRRGGSTPS